MSNETKLDKVIDARTFWHAIGARAVGAAVVTTTGPGGPRGFFALSATHLSADPPLLMVSIDKRTSALPTILEARHFAINYLSSTQSELAEVFEGRGKLQGADRFTTTEWTRLATGSPALLGAVGVLDCSLEDVIDQSSCVIAIGRLVAFTTTAGAPLVYYKGKAL
jgi:flavin reductase (DIM6/NTAB) family NADH-FMN oxidoreductase RutF